MNQIILITTEDKFKKDRIMSPVPSCCPERDPRWTYERTSSLRIHSTKLCRTTTDERASRSPSNDSLSTTKSRCLCNIQIHFQNEFYSGTFLILFFMYPHIKRTSYRIYEIKPGTLIDLLKWRPWS